MATTTASGPYKGLDLGTSRIVLATMQGERPKYVEQLNAFVSLPYAKMTEAMLDREKILHKVEKSRILAYGNRADEFANMLGGDTRRPMQTGLLNPREPKSIEMIELALSKIVGRAKAGEKICFSVPSAPVGQESDLVYHELTVTQMLEDLGYEVSSVNEGLAIVYAEMKNEDFTGIGISFGGGMCNVCLAYLALPAISFCTVRAGDHIDHSAASVTGETPTTVRLHKESDFSLSGKQTDNLGHALAIYYTDMIKEVARGLERTLNATRNLPRFKKPVPVVVSGGTAKVAGFKAALKKAIDKVDLPVEIGDIRVAQDPMNATAKGTLIAAMLNM